ncbi:MULTISPECIES: FGGY-family carbohydrate kinase [unclassified Mesorhizobium]|uniref:FGGY-family carbohydrate kinase n=1 Tax=unclassified Mesorhizobium TaxID=325217 RepID=UPI000FDCCC98|nr:MULTISPECIES: FGGY-family carbohydrate kinase [unclassified Mesorhizobium]TGQ17806.1 carbohydrate kinase [Mesorhizobium sp. M2E.F.Ca.ET.219.01.1.1]TGS10281.1 carbohydrate kinase [Mesorhizobium sp. M2E.F.Ca.ET.209.01.1.1]TGT64235.1 carbohydrate kinase [Mesorhizobium sp. M2E.F.Ca.ET.166.01.1.1]TGV97183.1 carbohydrate kinase [Mesorhizobium sp. M2E.F.Ca.ET.154.01.1.1]
MKNVLIGIDAGTSVIKSVAFDTAGRQIAATALPNRYETLPGGGAEQDLARTWTDTATTLRQLADKVPNLADRVIAIAVTGQGDGTWLIDKAGEPVAKGWLWLDARAAAVVEEIRARPEDRLRFEKTGSGLAACQQGSQFVFMKRNMPAMLSGAATAFHCKDWLYFRLTGERATDPSEGTFTFGDFRTRDYSDDVLDVLGVADLKHLLPPIVDGTSHSAGLSQAAADASGLIAGTPVVLAYVDVVCTALGAGLFDRQRKPGCSIIGSTGMHMRLAETPDEVLLNTAKTGYTMTMPAPGVFAQMQSNMAATLNIDWVLGLASGILASQGITRSNGEMIALVDHWIAASEPASLIYQPYVSEAGERGPFVDANARAGFVGISSRHGYADMVRAVFEGLAFAARDCYAAMGPLPSEIRLTGGAARSSALRKILGAAVGSDVRTSAREEAGAAGAAMIAAVCLGLYPSMDDCVGEWVSPLLGEAEPCDQQLAAIYEAMAPSYVMAHEALRPVWRSIAASKVN